MAKRRPPRRYNQSRELVQDAATKTSKSKIQVTLHKWEYISKNNIKQKSNELLMSQSLSEDRIP